MYYKNLNFYDFENSRQYKHLLGWKFLNKSLVWNKIRKKTEADEPT